MDITAHYLATESTTTAECVHLENQHAQFRIALATITDSLLIAEIIKNAKKIVFASSAIQFLLRLSGIRSF